MQAGCCSTSRCFLFVFLPTFYLLYLAGERGYWLRLGVILFGSVVFYEWSDPVFPLLVVVSALADWLIAGRIARKCAGRPVGQAVARPRRRTQSRNAGAFQIHTLPIDNLNSVLAVSRGAR